MKNLVIILIGALIIIGCSKKKDWDVMIQGEWLASEWVSIDLDDSSTVDYVMDYGFLFFLTFEKCKFKSNKRTCECNWRIATPDYSAETLAYYFEILPNDSLLFMIDKDDEDVVETWNIQRIDKDRIEMKRIFDIPGFDNKVVLERY